jgi:hypothetical protein
MNVNHGCELVNGTHGAPKSCGYLGTDATAVMYRSQVEKLQLPIWKASTALYPSIYLPTQYIGLPVSVAAAYMKSTVAESVKVAAMAAAAETETETHVLALPIPVFAYAWDHYHSGIHTLPKSSLVATMNISFESGASGVVWWGGTKQANNKSYWEWFENVEGPSCVKFCESLPGGC